MTRGTGPRELERRAAVFLDRDGVINRSIVRDGKPYPPASLNEFAFLPGVAEACRLLKEAGFLLVVVTNQPDVGRGTQRQAVVWHCIVSHPTLKAQETKWEGLARPARAPG